MKAKALGSHPIYHFYPQHNLALFMVCEWTDNVFGMWENTEKFLHLYIYVFLSFQENVVISLKLCWIDMNEDALVPDHQLYYLRDVASYRNATFKR